MIRYCKNRQKPCVSLSALQRVGRGGARHKGTAWGGEGRGGGGEGTYLSLEAVDARADLLTLGIIYRLHIYSKNNYSWTADYSLAGCGNFKVQVQGVR